MLAVSASVRAEVHAEAPRLEPLPVGARGRPPSQWGRGEDRLPGEPADGSRLPRRGARQER